MIVFRTDDARADIAAWRERGVDTCQPFDFQRQARLPDGSEATVGFSLGFATSARMPDLAFFVCENRAQQHFWKPAYQDHANGAEEISAARLVAREPARHGDFLARLFDGAVTEHPDGVSVACGPHRIDVVAQQAVPGWRRDPGDGALGAGLAVRAPGRPRATTPPSEAGNVAIEWVS